MQFGNLYELQDNLDEVIRKNHGLHEVDVFHKKVLSYQVEVGELANEWQLFKFWKKNPKPRMTEKCWNCSGVGKGYFSGQEWTGDEETCVECNGTGIELGKNPVLEEYIDGLHFLLSLGLELRMDDVYIYQIYEHEKDIEKILSLLMVKSGLLLFVGRKEETFHNLFSLHLRLGMLLGFTMEQIIYAYVEKNRINLERQNNDY